MTIYDAITMAVQLLFGMIKCIYQCDLFDHISAHIAHQVQEVVGNEVIRNPEGYIVDTLWAQANRLRNLRQE